MLVAICLCSSGEMTATPHMSWDVGSKTRSMCTLRKVSQYNNQYGFKNGKGTELWATLDIGESWTDADLSLVVFFCELNHGIAKVSVAQNQTSAQESCGELQSTTAHAISRCTFEEMPGKRVGGYVWDWTFSSFEDAKIACDLDSTCTGIYQSGPDALYEVRTGGSWSWASSSAKTWACIGWTSSGKMLT